MQPLVSVIIPTTCDLPRKAFLLRAIEGVLSQAVRLELIVVANGSRVDPGLLAELQGRAGLQVLCREEGNVSRARFAGLSHATGDFFCFLDDDDEFLVGTLAQRLASFSESVDVVVTNGYSQHDGVDRRWVPPGIAAAAGQDPMGSFLDFNWFASPASMFRAATVGRPLFDITARHFEWTLLFFKLQLAGLNIRFVDELGYRRHEDNPTSASKSEAYALAYTAFLRDELLTLDVPARHKSTLKTKLAAAFNELAQKELLNGRRAAAWSAHWQCLANGGLKYLSFTRHLLR